MGVVVFFICLFWVFYLVIFVCVAVVVVFVCLCVWFF